jgi:hypothetical protein
VQALPSLQFSGDPPAHAPPEQLSPVVHALPSLQLPLMGGYWHPDAGLHVSLVQGLPSLQTTGFPGMHAVLDPPAQWSPVVHMLPSSQVAEDVRGR